VKKVSFFARLSALVFAFDAFFKIFLVISLATIPTVLISGGKLVAYISDSELRTQIGLCFAYLFFTRTNELITYLPSGYRLAQRDTSAQIWMSIFHAETVIRSFILPKWLGGRGMAFSSPGCIKSDLNERDAKERASLARRLKVILWDCKVWIHSEYIIYVLVAVI